MKKIFKKINKFTRAAINVLVSLILGAIYFIFLFPFAIFIKLFGVDFLEVKKKYPNWISCENIDSPKQFLKRQ